MLDSRGFISNQYILSILLRHLAVAANVAVEVSEDVISFMINSSDETQNMLNYADRFKPTMINRINYDMIFTSAVELTKTSFLKILKISWLCLFSSCCGSNK